MLVITITSCDKVRPPLVFYTKETFFATFKIALKVTIASYRVYGYLEFRKNEKDEDSSFLGKVEDGKFTPLLELTVETAPHSTNSGMCAA
jgi:hypothetical protein